MLTAQSYLPGQISSFFGPATLEMIAANAGGSAFSLRIGIALAVSAEAGSLAFFFTKCDTSPVVSNMLAIRPYLTGQQDRLLRPSINTQESPSPDSRHDAVAIWTSQALP